MWELKVALSRSFCMHIIYTGRRGEHVCWAPGLELAVCGPVSTTGISSFPRDAGRMIETNAPPR